MNNTITLAGHVGLAPKEIILNSSSKSLVKFSLAVKEYVAAGAEPKTMWIDVEAWNQNAKPVLAAITKGREIVVHGRLSMNQYKDKAGATVIKPVVKLGSFYLCGPKPRKAD